MLMVSIFILDLKQKDGKDFTGLTSKNFARIYQNRIKTLSLQSILLHELQNQGISKKDSQILSRH